MVRIGFCFGKVLQRSLREFRAAIFAAEIIGVALIIEPRRGIFYVDTNARQIVVVTANVANGVVVGRAGNARRSSAAPSQEQKGKQAAQSKPVEHRISVAP